MLVLGLGLANALLPSSLCSSFRRSARGGLVPKMCHRGRLMMLRSGSKAKYDVGTSVMDGSTIQYNFEAREGEECHPTGIEIETSRDSSEGGGIVKKMMAQPTDIDIETLGGSSEGGSVKKVGPKVALNKMKQDSNSKHPTDIDIETLGGSSEGGPVKKTPIGSAPVIALEGDSTEEQPYQKVVVAAHFAVVLFNVIVASQAIFAGTDSMGMVEVVGTRVLPIIATIYASIVVGDFGTGVFHWSVDNYGSLQTPVVGSICHAFQGHHVSPWTITFRKFANNVFKIAYGCATPLLILTFLPNVDPYARLFLGLFINWWLVSQELHKFSHLKRTPPFIKKCMDMGLILSKKEHGLHHTAPFDTNYCILTGQNNKWLDETHFFRRLERIVYETTGNEANTWNEEGGGKVRARAMEM